MMELLESGRGRGRVFLPTSNTILRAVPVLSAT